MLTSHTLVEFSEVDTRVSPGAGPKQPDIAAMTENLPRIHVYITGVYHALQATPINYEVWPCFEAQPEN